MSDTHSETISDYQRKIELLEKALIRERNTKKKLEVKLDEKANQRLDENKDFLKAFEEAQSRQVQLQFLGILNKDIISDKKPEEMFDSYSRGLQKLLENCPVLLGTLTKDTWQLMTLGGPDADWKLIKPSEGLSTTLYSVLEYEPQQWHRKELDSPSTFNQLLRNNTLLFYIIELSSSQKRVIFLDINHYCYSEDFKKTLKVSGQNFSTAIKKRMTEIELSYNNQKLKNTLATLEKTQKQLAHTDKMASLGQLSAGIAHEINNPIGYVTSNLDVLKDYLQIYEDAFAKLAQNNDNSLVLVQSELSFTREDTPALIEACKNGVERVAAIVNSLKTFSRKDQTDFGDTQINDVIKSAIEMVWNQMKYDHQLEVNLLDELPPIYGNFGQLQQVFVNLFVNASHAMAEKGQLTVTSNLIGDAVEVTVTDTGCGIEPKNLKRLFEPFYTTKDESSGTGLGLSVSYAIIEKHNANISVNSTLDIGTTFTLRFPT